MNKQFPHITWLDVETTGLDAQNNYLLEVACLVTDTELNILDETGYSATIFYPEAYLPALKENSSQYVQDMHEKTRLWDRLPQGKLMSQVDKELKNYISEFIEPNQSWLAGNSITLDRNFLAANLTDTFNHLYYRSIDVSTIAGLAEWWYGAKFPKTYQHSALADIQESVAELQFMRKEIFK